MKLTKEMKSKLILAGKILAIVFVCFVIIMVIINKDEKVERKVGNLNDYGYIDQKGKWIYYVAPNDDLTQIGIFKIKNDGTDKQEITIIEDVDIMSLNVVDNYIYFIGIGKDVYNENDEVDNKIYRIKTTGKGLEVINDNEFNNNCESIYVIDKKIYYVGTDTKIYKMNLNGKNRKEVSGTGLGYAAITDEYIIYNDFSENYDEEAVSSEDTMYTDFVDNYVTKIMNRNGSNSREIISGKYLNNVNIEGKYIYYTNEDYQLYKTKIDSNAEECLIDDMEVLNLNVIDKYAYFVSTDTENNVCFYRLKLNEENSEPEKVQTLNSNNPCLNVSEDWIFYTDREKDTEAFVINLVKNDGSGEIVNLYKFDYSSVGIELDETTDEAE